MNNYKVYVHVNKHNGKKYFGITQQEVEKRWQNGFGYVLNDHFFKSIKKYGWSGFHHWILFSGLDKETACEIERQLIKEHMTTNSNFGYNKDPGGFAPVFSEEHKKKISEANKRRTKEFYKKIGEKHSKAVVCVETGETFDSLKSAADAIGVRKCSLCDALKGRSHTSGGYHWMYVGGDYGAV